MARAKDIIYIAFIQGGTPVYVSRSCSKACKFIYTYVGEENLLKSQLETYDERVRQLRKGDTTQVGLKSAEGNLFGFVRRYITNTPYGVKWKKEK